MLVAGLIAGGCSTSVPLGSLSGRAPGKAETPAAAARAGAGEPDITGSIGPALPPEQDLAFARAAASEVLGRGGKDSSTAWENPQTGARGTVTPIAAVYRQDGRLCRDFLASYVHAGSESWLQGEACQAGGSGRWEVHRLALWKRS